MYSVCLAYICGVCSVTFCLENQAGSFVQASLDKNLEGLIQNAPRWENLIISHQPLNSS